MNPNTETAPQPAVAVAANPLDNIIENTEARSQAEAAKADLLTADVYAKNANAYVIALGRDYGLSPAHALNMIHLIGGKPSLGAGARATFLKQAGYDWRPVVFNDDEVRLRFAYKGESMLDANGKPLELSFTIKDAERANFIVNSRGTGKVGNYDRFPKNMLFARCISNFHRFFASEVIGATTYDVGEVPLENVIEVTEQKTMDKATELRERLAAAQTTQPEQVVS